MEFVTLTPKPGLHSLWHWVVELQLFNITTEDAGIRSTEALSVQSLRWRMWSTTVNSHHSVTVAPLCSLQNLQLISIATKSKWVHPPTAITVITCPGGM